MEEKLRIEKVIDLQNMTSTEFAAEIGIKPSTLSHILNGRNKASLDVMRKIVKRFPSISFDWLILGNGSMHRQESKSHEPTLFDNLETNITKSDVSAHFRRAEKERDFSSIQSESPNNVDSDKNAETTAALKNIHEQNISKEISKIIVYFTDNTFKEFKN